jgi:hypothetical protein
LPNPTVNVILQFAPAAVDKPQAHDFRVDVRVAEADSRFRVVTSGVTEGDQVIVFPSNSIADGVRVKPRKQNGS